MTKFFNVCFVLLMLANLSGCGDSDRTLSLDMKSKVLTGVETTNLSGAEDFGRWTDGSPTAFKFTKGLPEHFKLVLTVGGAFGPNQGKTFTAEVGSQSQNFIPSNTVVVPNIVELEFDHVSTDVLTINSPSPTSPKELGMSADTRKLGISIIKLEILPI
jgi:phosphoglycerol transferase